MSDPHASAASEPDSHDHDDVLVERVGPQELFFDLVFVFALTQVTGLWTQDLTWIGLLRGLLVLALVWWSWVGFTWLTTNVGAETPAVRLSMFAAMGSMLVVSLAVPRAFGDWGLLFAVGYLVTAILFFVTYAAGARDQPDLLRALLRMAPAWLAAPILILIAGFLDAGAARAVLWIVAIVVSYCAPLLSGTSGWSVNPSHFAERYSLIVIIALGESIVSIGIGASGLPLDAREVAGALLGLTVAIAFWWLYFDVVALVAERRLTVLEGAERNAVARDSFSYLHLPMVAGIVLFALGVKKVMAGPAEPLNIIALTALLGGGALYLLGHVAFRHRNVGSWNVQRLVVAAILVALIPLMRPVNGLVVIAVEAALLVGLVSFEAVRFREARHAVRQHGAGGDWSSPNDIRR